MEEIGTRALLEGDNRLVAERLHKQTEPWNVGEQLEVERVRGKEGQWRNERDEEDGRPLEGALGAR